MIKRIIAILICFVSLSAVAMSGVMYYSERKTQAELNRQIADVQNEMDAKEMSNAAVRVQVLSDVASLSEKRLNEDAEKLNEIFGTAFTWHNYEEYTAMREKLIDEYGFDEHGQFLTDVFAPMKTADDDPEYNLIDGRGMQIEFSRCTAYCTGHVGLNYTYFGEIYFRVLGGGGSSHVLTDAYTVTVDADGNLKDLFVIDLST